MGMYLDGMMGLIVGDAVGVPVEFEERSELKKDPVTGIEGGGTYGLPTGSWSDDVPWRFVLWTACNAVMIRLIL